MEGSPFAGMVTRTPPESYNHPVSRRYKIEVSSDGGDTWEGTPTQEFRNLSDALQFLSVYHPPSPMEVIYRVISVEVCEVGRKSRDAEDLSEFHRNFSGDLPCEPLDRVEVLCNNIQRYQGKAEEFNWSLNAVFRIYSWRYLG